MSTRNLAAAVALAGGFVQGRKRIADEEVARKEREEDRTVQREERQLRLADVRRQNAQDAAVAEAGKPVGVQEVAGTDLAPGEMGPSQTAPTLASFKVGENNFLDRAQADSAAAAENTPEAQTSRIAKAYRSTGAPEKAMTLENAAVSRKRADEQYNQEKNDRLKKYKEEGVFDAVRAFRTGDASGLAKAFNAGGEYKLDGEPEITREDREVPGIGKIPTYNAKVRIVGPDGKVQERSFNSHDLSMQLMPYEKQLEVQRKGTDSDNKAAYQSAMLEQKIKSLELTGQIAEARALKAAASGGSIGREERLRFTSLFSDAGRRLGEAQRSLGSLQKDPLFMMNARKPGTPEASQLNELQDSIKNYGEERTLYQGLLAGSATGGGKQPSLADTQPKPSAAKPKAKGTVDHSNLWK